RLSVLEWKLKRSSANVFGRNGGACPIVWNVSQSFHASRDSFATSTESRVIAFGCHTMNVDGSLNPAASRNEAQSSPGAFVESSSRLQELAPWTSSDSTSVA